MSVHNSTLRRRMNMIAPVPKPTIIDEPRLRCGMVRRKTAKEISREWKEYCLPNLKPIVEL